jgi:hypothetical protein
MSAFSLEAFLKQTAPVKTESPIILTSLYPKKNMIGPRTTALCVIKSTARVSPDTEYFLKIVRQSDLGVK